jgi:hypothetical protein
MVWRVAEVKNAYSYVSTPHVFMAWYLVKHFYVWRMMKYGGEPVLFPARDFVFY